MHDPGQRNLPVDLRARLLPERGVVRADRSTQLGTRLYDRFGLDGAEVTNDVFESSRSVVSDQAENRPHTIKAVLVAALDR